MTLSAKQGKLLLLGIMLLAVVLRFFALNHGVPDMVYVDAHNFVGQAATMVEKGDFAPRNYMYPGLLPYTLAVIYRLGSINSFYWQYMISLILLALSGCGLVFANYLLARRVAGGNAALFATMLAAVCTTSVTYSRLPTPDIIMALFMTLTLWVMLCPKQEWHHALLLGMVTGLAIGTKFTALYLLPFVVIVPLFVSQGLTIKSALRNTVVTGVSALVVFTISTPFFWWHFTQYRKLFLGAMKLVNAGQIGHTQIGFFDYFISPTPTCSLPWLGTSLLANFGLLFLVLLLVSLSLAVALRGTKNALFLALYTMIYLALVAGAGRVKAFRYVIPVLPVTVVLVAWALEWFAARLHTRYRAILIASLAILVLAVPTWRTLHYLSCTTVPTTNKLAAQWVEKHLPQGASVFLSPFFVNNLLNLPLNCYFLGHAGQRLYGQTQGTNPEKWPLFYPGLVSEMRAKKVQYVVMDSYWVDTLSSVPENLRFFPVSVQNFAAFMAELKAHSQVIYSVRGWAEGRLGPDITIYEIW